MPFRMMRKLHIEYAGAIYPVMNRGHQRDWVPAESPCLGNAKPEPVAKRAEPIGSDEAPPTTMTADCSQTWTRPGFRMALAFGLLLFVTGCGTLMRHDFKESMHMEGETYIATKCDFFIIATGSGLPLIVDVPISLLTDTILLPFDQAQAKKMERANTP